MQPCVKIFGLYVLPRKFLQYPNNAVMQFHYFFGGS